MPLPLVAGRVYDGAHTCKLKVHYSSEYIIHSMYCNGKKCNSSQRAVVLCSYLVSLSCNSRTKINMRFVTDWFNSQ